MSPSAFRDVGDSTIWFPLGTVLDTAINARARAVAAAVAGRGLAGVREVRSTFVSVVVDYDPLAVDRDRIADAVARELGRDAGPDEGREIEIPVVYGGAFGPDLEDVAARSGRPPSAIVAAHADRWYHAFMVGFMPGFPYLGPVAPGIVAPRRATPRLRVPSGSVGIAGNQTGVYPQEGPGGWCVVGRTPMRLFDPVRPQPCLVSAGDRVRFTPVDHFDAHETTPSLGERAYDDGGAAGRSGTSTAGGVTVLQPGLLTTVQDAGRWGWQSSGVSPGGAMDAAALRAANAVVGNPKESAALEATLAGLDLRFEETQVVSVSGADLGATLDGRAMEPLVPYRALAGSRLRLTRRRSGARAYIAFSGGVSVPLVLGSRSTDLGSGFGGYHGRALRAGDCLEIGATAHDPAASAELPAGDWPQRRAAFEDRTRHLEAGGARLRVMMGPHAERFSAEALARVVGQRFLVTAHSNRVGYRLQGPEPILARRAEELTSEATAVGAVQVPPDGQPILLMADRRVTGGYPIVAAVIAADVPLAGQLAPGDWIELVPCTRAEAVAALRAQEG